MLLTENWHKLSAEEKYEERFNVLKNPGIEFNSVEAEQAYKERVQLFKDAIELKKSDRVPFFFNVGFYTGAYAGVSAQDMMYDYTKLGQAWSKFYDDFKTDGFMSTFIIGAGKVYEKLGVKNYKWPGNGTDPHTSYQCVEQEYMKAEDYDFLIQDPSGYWMRHYLPRIFGAMDPWKMLSPFTDIVELPLVGATMIPFGIPDVQEAFKKFLEAGQAALEWAGAIHAIDHGIIAKHGIPGFIGGISKAPYDTLGDTLRGTRAIMLDHYRRPQKVLDAMEKLVPLMIDMGVRSATVNRNPMVLIPLHKGADGFISEQDFAKFYWPTLKAVLIGLVNEGLVPYVFVEGSYNERLEYLADPELPEGKIIWIFDQTDMVKVKKVLGGKSCFGGNVPASMLKVGTPQQVEDYVKNLIENVGQDGGFMLTNGAVIEDAKPENLQAMSNAALKYGSLK